MTREQHEMKRLAAMLEDLYEIRGAINLSIEESLRDRPAETPSDRLARLHVVMREIQKCLYPPDRTPVRQDADGHWIWTYTCQRCHSRYEGRRSTLCPTCAEGTRIFEIRMPRDILAWTWPEHVRCDGLAFAVPKRSPMTTEGLARLFRLVAHQLDAIGVSDRDEM